MISLKNTLEAIGTKISAINSSLGNVPHRTLLWTNPNPSSSLTNKTISLSADYDEIEVIFEIYPYFDRTRVDCARVPNGLVGQINGTMGASSLTSGTIYNTLRQISFNSRTITINGGYAAVGGGSINADNNANVPYKIYGIKWGGV